MIKKKETFSQSILNTSWFLKGYDKLIHPVFLTFFARKKLNFKIIYENLLDMDSSIEGKNKRPYQVLDLACGTGWYGQKIALDQRKRDTHVFGVDIAKNAIKIAERRKNEKNLGGKIDFIRCNAENLSNFEDNSFQEVWICGALHQMPNVDLVLDEIDRVLDKDGKVFCQTFVKDADDKGIIINMSERLGHHFFLETELRNKLEKRNLKLPKISRYGFVALFVANREDKT